MKKASVGVLLLLGGCAYGKVDCENATQGQCSAHFARIFTDTALNINFPHATEGGGGVSYNSNPNSQIAGQAMELALTALKARDPDEPVLDQP